MTARFEAAVSPPEVTEAARVEEVARAMCEAERHEWEHISDSFADYFRRQARAAVAAYVAAQDGGAEEAVRPCPTCVREGGPYRCCPHCVDDPDFHKAGVRNHHDLPCSTCIDFALAPQAGAGQ